MRLFAFLTGALLGDGSLERSRRNARYAEGGANAAYLAWKRDLLAEYLPLTFRERLSAPHARTGRRYRGWWLRTAVHPLLTEWHSVGYPDGRKTVPRELVARHLTSFALAVWFCDDGHVAPRQAMLYTMAFTADDVAWLRDLIEQRFGLRPTVWFNARRQPSLGFGAADVPRIRHYLAAQALPGMAYKHGIRGAHAL
jgi:hypothetical protein